MAKWATWTHLAVGLGMILAWGIHSKAWAQQKPILPPPVSARSASPTNPSTLPPRVALPAAQAELPAAKPPLAGTVLPSAETYSYPSLPQPVVDAKTLIQQRAAWQAAQRARRLAALKWFGYSNSRPVAGVDCIHGDYSPSWTANNSHYPFRWVGAGSTWVAWLPAIASPR